MASFNGGRLQFERLLWPHASREDAILNVVFVLVLLTMALFAWITIHFLRQSEELQALARSPFFFLFFFSSFCAVTRAGLLD